MSERPKTTGGTGKRDPPIGEFVQESNMSAATSSSGIAASPLKLSGGGPLTVEDLAVVRQAREDSKKIRRCASVAKFSGWTTGLFGGITLLTGIGDWAAMALGLGLCGVAFFELRGGRLVGEYQERGARVLGLNQCALGVMLVAYALVKLQGGAVEEMMGQLKTGDAMMDETMASVASLAQNALYGTLAVVGVLVPGLTALYYFSRGPRIRRFVAKTPPWAVELMRAHEA